MPSFSRRRFIEGTVVGAGLVALPFRRVVAATLTPDIIEVEGTDHKKMVAAAVEALGGIKQFVHKGDMVVLKPNAAFANPPDWGTTTHPDTVAAMAQLCLDAGAKQVLVIEYPQAKGQKCLDRCGLTAAMALVPGVKVKVLGADDDFKTTKVQGGVACTSTDVAKAVLSADVLINLPAAKAHTQGIVSFGLKNAMGLIKDRQAFHTMFDLQQGIADLNRVIKPQLTIVDATRALLTNGPAGPGETSNPNRMIAGRNVVSVDAYSLGVARFNQRQLTVADVPHIALAGKAGLGEVEVAKLKVKKVTA
ncbi:MAG: DUF362 domain-containing protein [Deltaproteobacteria bacterium]|nr:DUF362 domain-containing protein [Deltaproteobacteria bacterium]